jgi:hypothetical protein
MTSRFTADPRGGRGPHGGSGVQQEPASPLSTLSPTEQLRRAQRIEEEARAERIRQEVAYEDRVQREAGVHGD